MSSQAKKNDQQTADMRQVLGAWNPTSPEDYLEGVRWSLETVTHLTEYQDEKANKILTAMAFLSALVGVVFAAVIDKCPYSLVSHLRASGYQCSAIGLIVIYGLFVLYFVLLGIGAALVVWAVKPRFNIPSTWHADKNPASLLFYEKIAEVSGKQWASAFAQHSANEVQQEYLKNAIYETYLIAGKIATKLRLLQPGIGFFFASIVVLVILLPLSVGVVARVEGIPIEKTTALQKGDGSPVIGQQETYKAEQTAPKRKIGQ